MPPCSICGQKNCKRAVQPTRVMLKEGLQRLHYDLSQLYRAGEEWRDKYEGRVLLEPQQVVCNALIDSVLVHSRAVQAFFNDQAKRCDDIVAADYLSQPTRVANFEPVREKINKTLAHVTAQRTPPSQPPPWDIKSICLAFVQAVEDFITAPDLGGTGLSASQFEPQWATPPQPHGWVVAATGPIGPGNGGTGATGGVGPGYG